MEATLIREKGRGWELRARMEYGCERELIMNHGRNQASKLGYNPVELVPVGFWQGPHASQVNINMIRVMAHIWHIANLHAGIYWQLAMIGTMISNRQIPFYIYFFLCFLWFIPEGICEYTAHCSVH